MITSGRCGACAKPARRWPSGHWTHTGRPCPPYSQVYVGTPGLPVPPAVFVPEGEPLPTPDAAGAWVLYAGERRWFPPETVAELWDEFRASHGREGVA